MSLKEFGVIFLCAILAVGAAILAGAAIGNASRDATLTEACVSSCTPFLHGVIRKECYCADAEGKYTKRLLPERTP